MRIKTSHYEEERLGYAFHNRFNAVTVDANFLKQCRSIETALLAVGQSFGEHFVKRVLSGLDLDYSRSIEKTIRRWLKCTKRAAPLVVSVSVHEEKDEHFSGQLELPGFERLDISELSYWTQKALNSK